MSEQNSETDLKLTLNLQVLNDLGLHARVAARIAKTVQSYECKVLICRDSIEAEADSILSLLTLGAPKGSELTIIAQGPEAACALTELEKLFKSHFGE